MTLTASWIIERGTMQGATAKLEISELGESCLLMRCSGGLSWEDRTLLAERMSAAAAGRTPAPDVILDLFAVEFVNSAGIGALFQLAQRVRSGGGKLLLAAVPPVFLRMFRMAGLDRLASLDDSVAAAAERLGAGAAWGPAQSGGAGSAVH
ncbi:MAG: STAS domain-containing protein [Phycisphaerales bacterium]|nr:STAS domain-containing protein [Phycisphaerales bacterium]